MYDYKICAIIDYVKWLEFSNELEMIYHRFIQ